MAAVPGWYPDPDRDGPAGSLRWWDGQRWTDHITAVAAAPDAGPSTPPPPVAPPLAAPGAASTERVTATTGPTAPTWAASPNADARPRNRPARIVLAVVVIVVAGAVGLVTSVLEGTEVSFELDGPTWESVDGPSASFDGPSSDDAAFGDGVDVPGGFDVEALVAGTPLDLPLPPSEPRLGADDGEVEAGGEVLVALLVPEPSAVTIDVRSTSGLDPVAALYTSDGRMIATNDDRGDVDVRVGGDWLDPLLDVDLDAETYVLAVRGWGTTAGTFTVQLRPSHLTRAS